MRERPEGVGEASRLRRGVGDVGRGEKWRGERGK